MASTKLVKSYSDLYAKSTHEKIKVWSICVYENDNGHGIIKNTYGYDGNKLVCSEKIISAGKNIGKKNQTTPIEQSINEAESMWKKKQMQGYIIDKYNLLDNKESTHINTVSKEKENSIMFPMLALDYTKRQKDIEFPCFVQRKLDGVRCVAYNNKLYSRNGKLFSNHLIHITNELAQLNSLYNNDLILDGELYSDTLTFQEIVGLVKNEKSCDIEKIKNIYLYVYDMIDTYKVYNERKEFLEQLPFSNYNNLKLLDTELCLSKEHMKDLHDKYVSEKYEGIMLRNINGKYKLGHRSKDLQKYKEFMDSEYKVVGYKEGDGIEKGCVIWVCETDDPETKTFHVRPSGSHEERRRDYLNADDKIGKKYLVKYQELTSDGIPRFPVGICFRDIHDE